MSKLANGKRSFCVSTGQWEAAILCISVLTNQKQPGLSVPAWTNRNNNSLRVYRPIGRRHFLLASANGKQPCLLTGQHSPSVCVRAGSRRVACWGCLSPRETSVFTLPVYLASLGTDECEPEGHGFDPRLHHTIDLR